MDSSANKTSSRSNTSAVNISTSITGSKSNTGLTANTSSIKAPELNISLVNHGSAVNVSTLGTMLNKTTNQSSTTIKTTITAKPIMKVESIKVANSTTVSSKSNGGVVATNFLKEVCPG